MTQKNKKLSSGLPAPITKLTYEQDLRLRVLKDKLNENYDSHKKDIITLFLALQKQNFVLGNSLTNLLENWPDEQNILIDPSKGISFLLQHKK